MRTSCVHLAAALSCDGAERPRAPGCTPFFQTRPNRPPPPEPCPSAPSPTLQHVVHVEPRQLLLVARIINILYAK
jgi:hypothetical protein